MEKNKTFKDLSHEAIINVLRNNIIIDGDTSRVGLTVLVVDNYVLSLLNATIGLSSITDIGYLLVDIFETDKEIEDGKRRKSYEGLDVVYFFADNSLSVERICLDYYSERLNKQFSCIDRLLACTIYRGIPLLPRQVASMYRDARIITIKNYDISSKDLVYEQLTVRRRNANGHLDLLLNHIKRDTFSEECIVNYIPLETDIFTMELYDTISILYSYKLNLESIDDFATKSTKKIKTKNTQLYTNIIRKAKIARSKHIKTIAQKLASVFMVLDHMPNIRFKSCGDLENSSLNSCQELASIVTNILCKYRDNGGFSWSSHNKDIFDKDDTEDMDTKKKSDSSDDLDDKEYITNVNSTLLIVDRIDDIVPVLIHDFSYSGTIVDLLDHDPVLPYLYKYVDNRGKKQEMEVMLDETDCVYQELRHLEIIEISKKIEFELEQRNKKKLNLELESNSRSGLEDAREALLKLANNENFINKKYFQHIDIATKIYKMIDKRNLTQLMILEQELITGVDSAGNKISHSVIIQKVKTMFTKGSEIYLSKRIDRIRILLLIVVCMQELNKSTLKELISLSKIESQGECAINNLLNINIPICQKVKFVRGAPIIDKNKSKIYAKECLKLKKQSRYITKIEHDVSSLIKDELSDEEFPFQYRNSHMTTLKKQKDKIYKKEIVDTIKKSDMSKRTYHSKFNEKKTPLEIKDNKNYIVVFVIGGITQMEINALKKISMTYNKNIIIGSTSLISQSDFITQLMETKNFNDEENEKNEETDEENDENDENEKKEDI
jgi:hypothetical protein